MRSQHQNPPCVAEESTSLWVNYNNRHLSRSNTSSYSHYTDKSVVLKYITIYNKESDTMEEVLLEELQVFKVSVAKSSGVFAPFLRLT